MNKIISSLCLSLLLLGATALGMSYPEWQLHEAAKDGNLKKVERLIAQGVSIETKDNCGRTPLMWAAIFDHEDVCQLLIRNKASIEARDHGQMTPLLCAVKYGSQDACKLLMASKASLEVIDLHGQTPLMLTTRHDIIVAGPNREALCKRLIDAQEAMIKLLIDAQLEPTITSKAAIVTLLGIAKKRQAKLSCHMPYDIAKIIAREACETIRQNKRSVIGQINKQINKLDDPAKTKWLAYLNQHCLL